MLTLPSYWFLPLKFTDELKGLMPQSSSPFSLSFVAIRGKRIIKSSNTVRKTLLIFDN